MAFPLSEVMERFVSDILEIKGGTRMPTQTEHSLNPPSLPLFVLHVRPGLVADWLVIH